MSNKQTIEVPLDDLRAVLFDACQEYREKAKVRIISLLPKPEPTLEEEVSDLKWESLRGGNWQIHRGDVLSIIRKHESKRPTREQVKSALGLEALTNNDIRSTLAVLDDLGMFPKGEQ